MNTSNRASSNKTTQTRDRKRVFFHRFLDILAIGFCLWLVFQLVGHGLCKVTINRIEELTNTQIEVESIDFRINGSVVIEGLVVRGRAEEEAKYDDAILKAKTIRARFGIGSLLLFRSRLKTITVRDFVFNVQYDVEMGRWNLSGVTTGASKIGGGKIPLIHFEKGALQYSKKTKTDKEVLAEVPVDAEFGAAEKPQDGYVFNIRTSKEACFGESSLSGTWRPGRITVTGVIAPGQSGALEKAWSAYAMAGELNYERDNSYSLKLAMRDLVYRDKVSVDGSVLAEPLSVEAWGAFTTLQEFFDRYRPQGRADIELEASGNLSRLIESKINGKVYCKDVSICDRNFPYAVEHMVGQVEFTEKSATMNNLSGEHNGSVVTFNGWREGFGANRRYEIEITSDNMVLDEDLYNALSAKWQKQWSIFSPSGLTAIDYRTEQEQQTDKKRTVTLKLLDAEATYRYFPYPLKHLTGQVTITKDKVELKDVVAREGDDAETGLKQSVKIDGEILLADGIFNSVELSVRGSDVPLDGRLEGALPEDIKRFYRKLSPAGRFDLDFENMKIFNATEGGKFIDFGGTVGFKDCKFNISPAIIELDVGLKRLKGLYKTGEGFHDVRGDVIARCGDGRLLGEFELKQAEENSKYVLQAGFENIELKRFALGTKQRENNERTSGKVSGSLSVAGQIGENYWRMGKCKLVMRDMEVGRPSALGKILGALKLTEPKDYAFDEMYVDSYIKQDKVLVEKLDLSGEGLAFNGSGWMDLASEEVDLTLTARGRRLATAEPGVLQSLTDVVGLGMVRMEVKGSIYEPEVTTTTLPVLRDTLGIFGGGD